MENQEIFKTPSKTLARMQIVHLGKILFNLQFIAIAIMFISIITFILPAVYYLILIFLALFTFFIVFLDPGYLSLWKGGEPLSQIAHALAQSWQYTIPIVAILSIASVVCLCFDKHERHPARITISIIICILAIIVLVAKMVNGGAL